MGTVAAMFKTMGLKVTGSDQAVYPPMSDFLRDQGVVFHEGYAETNLSPKPDLAIVGTALSQSSSTRLWREAFLPPVSASPTNSAGDQRIVQVDDRELARGTSSGVRFPVSRRTPVVSANTGTVVFIGALGLLGNTIVIDHGFGLASVYGHLSEVSVTRGITVQRGQEIGKTGSTGFAQSEEVYFEMRLHGVPVSPNEWWDQTWVTDHIDNKVNFVLRDAN